MASNSGTADISANNVSALHKQLQAASVQVTSLQLAVEEKDMALKGIQNQFEALKKKVTQDILPNNERLKDRIKELEKQLASSALLKAEQDVIVSALRRDVRSAVELKDSWMAKYKQLEDSIPEYKKQLSDHSQSLDAANKLQLQLSEKNALITRLRTELQTSERNYALKNTLLASYDVKLNEMKEEIANSKQLYDNVVERVTVLQTQLAESELLVLKKTEEIRELTGKYSDICNSHKEELINAKEQLLEDYNTQLESYQKEYQKRSALAKTVIEQKDEEIEALRSKISELQVEIDSGAPGERKILALAELQARRDVSLAFEKENKSMALEQMQEMIAGRDFELAGLQQKFSLLNSEVLELRRSVRRDGLSMDYVKNVVHKYMSYPTDSPERRTLVPVIATILQFSDAELQSVVNNESNLRVIKEMVPSSSRSASRAPSRSSSLSPVRNDR